MSKWVECAGRENVCGVEEVSVGFCLIDKGVSETLIGVEVCG